MFIVISHLITSGYDLSLIKDALRITEERRLSVLLGAYLTSYDWQKLFFRAQKYSHSKGRPTKAKLIEDGLWQDMPENIRLAFERKGDFLFTMLEPKTAAASELQWSNFPWWVKVAQAIENTEAGYLGRYKILERRISGTKLIYILRRIIADTTLTEEEFAELLRGLDVNELYEMLRFLSPIAEVRGLTFTDLQTAIEVVRGSKNKR